MKILIVGLNFYPEPVGAGRYTGEMAEYLVEHGHSVRVITTPPYYPHWNIQEGYRAPQYRRETWQGIEVQRCPLWVPRRPTGFTRILHLASFALSSLPALVGQLAWKPDIVLCIAPALMCAPFVLSFAYLSGAKAWLHVQDFELDAAARLRMLPGRQIVLPIARAMEQRMLNGFVRVSTICEKMRRLCIDKGVEPEHVLLMPNWVDTTKIYPLPHASSLRGEFRIPAGTFVVLYHGSMGRKQGLDLLLQAARLLALRADFLFVLCGDGAAKPELVESAGTLSNVRFLELQPEAKLNDLVNLADVHVLPQLADAADLVMPSKLSTMLASGKPVIAGACPGTQIYDVLNRIGVVIQPEDAGALAESLIRLYESPSERCRLGDLGRGYACQYLEKDTILSRLCDSLEQDN